MKIYAWIIVTVIGITCAALLYDWLRNAITPTRKCPYCDRPAAGVHCGSIACVIAHKSKGEL